MCHFLMLLMECLHFIVLYVHIIEQLYISDLTLRAACVSEHQSNGGKCCNNLEEILTSVPGSVKSRCLSFGQLQYYQPIAGFTGQLQ